MCIIITTKLNWNPCIDNHPSRSMTISIETLGLMKLTFEKLFFQIANCTKKTKSSNYWLANLYMDRLLILESLTKKHP